MRKNRFNMIVIAIAVLAMALLMAGCGKQAEEAAPEVAVDYGSSELYSQEDMDAAVEAIKAQFADFEGCELHSITYAGDECMTEDNVKWLNELEEANDNEKVFTEVIEFTSSFHSPKEGGDAWEPDTEYEDWQWWLGRESGGEWKVESWGY